MMKQRGFMKRGKIPLRKCVGCLEMKEKKRLIRVVKSNSGGFSLDYTGKNSGRGAYICPDISCFERVRKQKGLERSFKCAVPASIYEDMKNEIARRKL